MYGFEYFYGTLSVTFHLGVSAEGVTTPSTVGTKDGRQILNNGATVIFIDSAHRLQAMGQLPVECELGWIEEHNQVHLIVENTMLQLTRQ